MNSLISKEGVLRSLNCVQSVLICSVLSSSIRTDVDIVKAELRNLS